MGVPLEHLDVGYMVGRPRLRSGVVVEPCPRRIRAFLGGVAVVDSPRALLVFEPGRLPVYWFPAQDVRTDLLAPAPDPAPVHLGLEVWSLRVGERVVGEAAWSLGAPGPERSALAGHLAFSWDRLDAWFEEDDEVFVHARDPYARVDILNSSRHVRVEVDGALLAESRRPRLLFESGLPTRYYLPKPDVRLDLLEPSPTSSRCPYKGVATYWSLRLGETVVPDIAWAYPHPIPECVKVENLVCFFTEKVDLIVDGELIERPVTEWS